MKFTLEQANEQNRKFDASGKTIRHGLGQLQPEIAEQKVECSLVGKSQGRKTRVSRVAGDGPCIRIALVNFRKRELDRDNLIGGFKPLRDAIARWLGLDDNEKFIEWNYGQIITKGTPGTVVRIEKI